MTKKRTKKEKLIANTRRVNSQFNYKFNESYSQNPQKKDVVNTEDNINLASIKKELLKSLIIATLILISLMVIYWVQN